MRIQKERTSESCQPQPEIWNRLATPTQGESKRNVLDAQIPSRFLYRSRGKHEDVGRKEWVWT